MNPHVDVESTCMAIKSLVNAMSEADRVKRIELFATVKTLCDAIQAQAEDEGAWNDYAVEKMLELLFACGAMAGVREHVGMIAPDSLARTALDSLESAYLGLKG